jgi:hypothetical protein
MAKRKSTKDKQWSTKHTYKTKDRVTRKVCFRVSRSFVFCLMFCRSLFVFCTSSFDHCVVCSSSMYGFWLLLWYLQTFLVTRSLVLYVCFVHRCLSFCTFSFGHCVVCSSSIYERTNKDLQNIHIKLKIE